MTNERFTNPFPGLRPFESTEDHLFFGRDGQSDELLRRLRRSRFLAVLGTSGSGKSSLVRAGMLPSLYGGLMTQAGSGWRVALFRPGHDPIGNLAAALSGPEVFDADGDDAALQKTITEATLRRSALGLVEATRQARIPANENLLVVVDQFEEIFRFRRTSKREGPEDEAAAFIKLLLEAKRQTEVPIYIVITMRSDFLGDCSQFRDLPEAINDGQYLIPRMTRDQRREAITGPVAVGGGEISGRLVNRLLNDVGDDPDHLPILQHALMRTWDSWMRDRRNGEALDLRHYEAVGTMSDALSRHADEAYDELPDENSRSLAEKLFKSLTEKGPDNREIRRPSRVKEIAAIAEASPAAAIAVIETFRRAGRSFLMPPASVPLDAESLIDISHESLIRGWERLRKWVDQEARSAQIYRRIAETAALHREDRAGLWRDPDLALALRWRSENRPNAVWAQHYHPDFDGAMAFIDASKEANEAEIAERERQRRSAVRRTRIFATVLGIAFLISLGFGIFAFDARNKAYAARNEAVEEKKKADVARSEAEKEKVKAQESEKRAVDNEQIAQQEKTKAEEAALIAEQQRQEAQAATERARQAQIVAEQNQKETDRLVLESLREGMLARRQTLNDKSNLNTLAERLIQVASPEEAAYWRNYYATALAEIGRPDLSKAESSKVLETFGDNLSALTNRGYMSLIRGLTPITGSETKEALKDFERIRELDPQYSLNYLNLGVTQANLKDYSGAENSIQRAIEWYRPGYFDGVFDSEVSDDIKRATRQKVIYADGNEFNAALYYELASIEAFRGGNNFEIRLNEADQNAERTGSLNQGYLTALNWAWLQVRKEPKDYGAWAVQAHLWRKAGYDEWARYYYQKFQCEHEGMNDPRYEHLAAWVKRQARTLPKSGVPFDCNQPPVLESDASTTRALRELKNTSVARRWRVFEADELASIGRYEDAIAVLDPEIERNPDNIELLLARARYRQRAGYWRGYWGNAENKKKLYEGAREDFATLLKLTEQDPAYKPIVYLWWTFIGPELGALDESEKKHYFEKTINLGPANSGALSGLSDLIASSDPAKAIELLKRSLTLDPSAGSYYKLALLQNKVGSYRDALASIKLAIALQNDNADYYEERRRAEAGLGMNAVEYEMHLAEGYLEVADARVRSFKAGTDFTEKDKAFGEAMDAYRKSQEILSRLPKSEKVSADLAIVNAKIMRLQEIAIKKPETR
jgi:tetratricopeptide (TPR) repeat protein